MRNLRMLRKRKPSFYPDQSIYAEYACSEFGLAFEELDGGTGLVFRISSATASHCFGGGRCSFFPQNTATAATLAAERALEAAGIRAGELACVTTHNPFAVNDLWLSQQTGIALERMNPYGCSLIFGHPQAPTGLRSIVELVHALRERGGGVGLFTGCAAGDTGAALVLRVD